MFLDNYAYAILLKRRGKARQQMLAKKHGYTIVEVMIFLAVSGALLVSALMLVGGQQRKTEFSQAVREIENVVQDIINDVSTGYYSRPSDFTCVNDGGTVKITPGANALGTNKDCMFVGRLIQFAVAGTDKEGYSTFTTVGLRQLGDTIVENLTDANPTILGSSTQKHTLKYGLKAKKMTCCSGANIGVVGFFASLDGSGGTSGGSQHTDLRAYSASALDQTEIANTLVVSDLVVAGADGVIICFESSGTDQHANLIIGGNNRQTSTQLEIENGPCV